MLSFRNAIRVLNARLSNARILIACIRSAQRHGLPKYDELALTESIQRLRRVNKSTSIPQLIKHAEVTARQLASSRRHAAAIRARKRLIAERHGNGTVVKIPRIRGQRRKGAQPTPPESAA